VEQKGKSAPMDGESGAAMAALVGGREAAVRF